MLFDCRGGVSVAESGDACSASASLSQPVHPSMVEDSASNHSISGSVGELASTSNPGSPLAVPAPAVLDETSVLGAQPMDMETDDDDNAGLTYDESSMTLTALNHLNADVASSDGTSDNVQQVFLTYKCIIIFVSK